jgi:hypothetical protein
MLTIEIYRLLAVRPFGDNLHICHRTNQRDKTLPDDRLVVYHY